MTPQAGQGRGLGGRIARGGLQAGRAVWLARAVCWGVVVPGGKALYPAAPGMPATGKANRARAKSSRNKRRPTQAERLVAKDSHARQGAPAKLAPGEHCNGRKANQDSHCTQPAGWGTDHVGYGRCKLHGGNTANGKAAAAKLRAEDMVEGYGLPVDIDPQEALLDELRRTAGHVHFMGQLVAKLNTDGLAGPVGTQGSTEGKVFIPKHEQHVWITMYQEERRHLARVAKSCIEAGIEERRTQLAEQQGLLIAQVIKGVLKDLGVDEDKRVPKIVGRHLHAVAQLPEATAVQ